MSCLHIVFSNYPGNYRDVMIWATCCLAYTLDLLELVNLQLNRLFTSTLWVTYSYQRLPQATTYPYLYMRTDNNKAMKWWPIQSRAQIRLVQSTHAICAVHALMQWFTRWGSAPGPLLLLWQKWLTRNAFSTALSRSCRWTPLSSIHKAFELGLLYQLSRLVSVTWTWKFKKWCLPKYANISPQDLPGLLKNL